MSKYQSSYCSPSGMTSEQYLLEVSPFRLKLTKDLFYHRLGDIEESSMYSWSFQTREELDD
jgi:hypothetical protein